MYGDLIEFARLVSCPLLHDSFESQPNQSLALSRLRLVLMQSALAESWWEFEHYRHRISFAHLSEEVGLLKRQVTTKHVQQLLEADVKNPLINLPNIVAWCDANSISSPNLELVRSAQPAYQQEHCTVCKSVITITQDHCENKHPINRCLVTFKLIQPFDQVWCCESNVSHISSIDSERCPLCLLPVHPIYPLCLHN